MDSSEAKWRRRAPQYTLRKVFINTETNLIHSRSPRTLTTPNYLKAIMLSMSRSVKTTCNNSSLSRPINESICAETFPREVRTRATGNAKYYLTYPHLSRVTYGASQYVLHFTTTVLASNVPTCIDKVGRQLF